MSPLCYNLGMEGMVRAIVAGLFVMLVVLTIVIFSFSLLLPVKMAKKDQNASGAPTEPAQATPPSLLRLLLELQGQKQQPPPPTGGQPAPSEPAPPPTGGQPPHPTPPPPPPPPHPTPPPNHSPTSIGTSPLKKGGGGQKDGSP